MTSIAYNDGGGAMMYDEILLKDARCDLHQKVNFNTNDASTWIE